MEVFTDLAPRFALKHVCSRWLSLQKVCLRILEQYPNLKQYFLVYLPAQETFKKEIQNTRRYRRIAKTLSDPVAQVCISFVAFAAGDFEVFLTEHQTSDPMIHLMYENLIKLMYNVARKFIKESHVSKESDFSSLDFTKHQKHPNKIDIGTRATSLLCKSDVSENDKRDVQLQCLKFYVKVSEYLQAHLPVENEIIKAARALQPSNRLEKWSLNAVSRLALTIAPILSKEMSKVFSVSESASAEDICDLVRCQWRGYQTETIVTDWHTVPVKESHQSRRNQMSYWKETEFEWCDIEQKDVGDTHVPVDEYWAHVFGMEDENGQIKFPQLSALIKCILSLSHGNSGPEKGFSLNKAILQTHGVSLNEDTLSALRNVRDKLIRLKGVSKFVITNAL